MVATVTPGAHKAPPVPEEDGEEGSRRADPDRPPARPRPQVPRWVVHRLRTYGARGDCRPTPDLGPVQPAVRPLGAGERGSSRGEVGSPAGVGRSHMPTRGASWVQLVQSGAAAAATRK